MHCLLTTSLLHHACWSSYNWSWSCHWRVEAYWKNAGGGGHRYVQGMNEVWPINHHHPSLARAGKVWHPILTSSYQLGQWCFKVWAHTSHPPLCCCSDVSVLMYLWSCWHPGEHDGPHQKSTCAWELGEYLGGGEIKHSILFWKRERDVYDFLKTCPAIV